MEQQELSNFHGETQVNAVQPQQDKPFVKKVPRKEIERRKKENLCYKCGGAGHLANECRTGWRYTGRPQEPEQPKQQGKQKRSAAQLRQHIRALIDESFDGEQDEEYIQFVQEVEEMGF